MDEPIFKIKLKKWGVLTCSKLSQEILLSCVHVPNVFLHHLTSGGGRNVDDQNVDRPKISERRNGLFS